MEYFIYNISVRGHLVHYFENVMWEGIFEVHAKKGYIFMNMEKKIDKKDEIIVHLISKIQYSPFIQL